ncbi:glycoside hydrolase family 13 protein [Nesterenkonia sphaerica]|uniref:Glycoside hydrolase family 13 protein n=1 Tax=Nesterenkonia sphaerica TaxID=1804988 RepID=A0A5R9AMZ7_9MICC|nr:glycoside hydrolase family 13 protein [Nesterenkonia sphaerica]TLP79514.1 glycoside hydrolase family 13 protein [Nesterenkonia sphaerica]
MTRPPQPHHDGSALYVSTQEPALGETVTLRLRVPDSYPALDSVLVRSNPDHEPHWDSAHDLGSVDGWQWWEAQITVANPRHGYRWMLVRSATVSAPEVEWVNQAGVHTGEVLDAADFSLVTRPGPPDWLTHSVMYQIFPDRFATSARGPTRSDPAWAEPADWQDPVDPVMPSRVRQFYGGELDGITEKLGYLENLGVGIIYLTPFFPAASNHRYDAASFTTVDPHLGGDEALIRLIDAAHHRGIKVIGDLTLNHSGNGHEWFQRARRDPSAPERSFYYFSDETADAQYESWLGTASLPKFNWASPQLREAFIDGPGSVVAKWLQPPFNLDGWRIDVANMTGRLREVDLNQEVRTLLRRTMEQVKPDSALLAESTNDATSDLTGDAWHGAMTYPSFTRPLWQWLSAPQPTPYRTAENTEETVPWFFGQPAGGIPAGTAADFASAVDTFNAPIPWRVRLANMNPLDTHDTARFAQHAAPGTAPTAVALQMTLPGLPTVFAGDEFGLRGADGELSRTPLPWTQLNAPDLCHRMELYRELISLRKQHRALRDGGMRWLHTDDHSVAFLRESSAESLVVFAAAPSAGELHCVDLAEELPGAQTATRLWGTAELITSATGVQLRAQGPSCAIWHLPGVVLPQR